MSVLKLKKFVRKQLKTLLVKLCFKLFPELNKDYELSWVIYGALAGSKDPIKVINYYATDLNIPVQELWLALKKLKAAHSPAYDVSLRGFSDIDSEELRLLFFARKITEDNGPVNPSCMKDLASGFEKASGSIKNKSVLRSVIASAFIEKCDLENVENNLVKIGVPLNSLTDHQKVRLMARYFAAQNSDNFLDLKRRVGSLSREALLKIDQMYFSMEPEGNGQLKKLERSFCDLPFKISDIYEKELKPVFDQIPEDQDFISARFNPDLIKTLENEILSKVQSGQPLSFIRVGDGECYGLADSVYVDEDGEYRQEVHWWGERLTVSLRQELQLSFREALSDATILGVPTVLRLIKEFNLSQKGGYAANSLISRIVCVIKGMAPFVNGKTIVEDQSNLYLFRRPFIDDLFSSARKVVVVSGLNPSLVNGWAPQPEKLEYVEIPTHRLLKKGDVGGEIEGILPNVYRNYIDIIKKLSGPGVVFLVSGGFIGKIFIAEAAKQGSVALDIGQALVTDIRSQRSVG